MNSDIIELYEADAQLLMQSRTCVHGVRLIEDCRRCEELYDIMRYWQDRSALYLTD